MKNLYMIAIGGKTAKSNIEVHDIQFLIEDEIDSTHDALRKNWYGLEKSLHMDSYLTVKGVEGYEIVIKESKNATDDALYCVTFGGYQKDVFQEMHAYELVIATSEREARANAMAQIKTDLINLHVDNIVEINQALTGSPYDLHFIKSENSYALLPEWQGYTKLG